MSGNWGQEQTAQRILVVVVMMMVLLWQSKAEITYGYVSCYTIKHSPFVVIKVRMVDINTVFSTLICFPIESETQFRSHMRRQVQLILCVFTYFLDWWEEKRLWTNRKYLTDFIPPVLIHKSSLLWTCM
jgi:hypothetical protein